MGHSTTGKHPNSQESKVCLLAPQRVQGTSLWLCNSQGLCTNLSAQSPAREEESGLSEGEQALPEIAVPQEGGS